MLDSQITEITSLGEYNELWNQEKKALKKSKFLAVLFGLIPGGGKVYAGNFKSGIISFMTVGLLSVQALDAYNKKGVKSVSFVGYSILSTLFYAGSINGGVQQIDYNRNITHEKFNNVIRLDLSISIQDLLSK